MSISNDSDTHEQDQPTESEAGPSTQFVRQSDLATQSEVAEGRFPGVSPEANVILISHPAGGNLGRRWLLHAGIVMEIGRSTGSDISLPDALSVSRHHALLRFEAGEVYLEDLGSTNGTYVNDRSVGKQTVLRSGDRFQVGTVHFKFLHELDVEHAYYETLYQLAMRDGLTEIFNQRKFAEELEREFLRSARYERSLSLVLMDLDHFKKLNDEFGHLCGDHVLKELCTRVLQHLRPEQTFARVGGEEFAILSPETDSEGAARLAEKLRLEIGGRHFRFQEFRISLTCSFGVCGKTERMRTSEQLYEAADRALYVAKNGGRDRTSIADW